MRLFYCFLVGLLAITGYAFASPTLNVTALGAVLDDLSTASNAHVAVATLTLDSSGLNAFSLTVSSDSTDGKTKGRLVRYESGTYQDETSPGNYCDYTVDLVPKGTGTLGCVEPVLPSNTVASPDIVLTYTSYSMPTSGYQYDLKINTSANSKLFRGAFRDVLTITMIDL